MNTIFIVWFDNGVQRTNQFEDTPEAIVEAREIIKHIRTLKQEPVVYYGMKLPTDRL